MNDTNTINLDFINALTKVLSNYIDQQVDKKVGEVLASHSAIREIDENFEKRIHEIAQAEAREAIDQHCGDENHKDDDDIESVVSEHDFSDQVYEAVNDAINDHDFDDAITASLADYDFSEHIREAINAIQFKVSVE